MGLGRSRRDICAVTDELLFQRGLRGMHVKAGHSPETGVSMAMTPARSFPGFVALAVTTVRGAVATRCRS